MKPFLKATLLYALFCLGTGFAAAADLNLTISNIQTMEGDIRIAIYNSEETFQKTPWLTQVISPKYSSEEVLLEDLPNGDYAILLFQDLNKNKELDSNLVGMPTEPWSASLQGKRLFGAPKWSDVRVSVNDESVRVSLPLR